jgi:hypothetical protein
MNDLNISPEEELLSIVERLSRKLEMLDRENKLLKEELQKFKDLDQNGTDKKKS